MAHSLEYYLSVQRPISASVAAFALFLFAGLFVPASVAQVNGAPASVTSPGFGGHAINGAAPSVTSVGPRGFAPSAPHGGTFTTSTPHNNHHDHNGDPEHRRHHDAPIVGGYYAVPVAVPYDDGSAQAADDDSNDGDYQGGPTIFDRRGSGAQSYVPPVANVPTPHTDSMAGEDPVPEVPQEPTLLVFKDGRKVEVGNYAIVGQILYDLTPGRPREIALASIDLNATQKENDDRGVNFQLPPGIQIDGSQAN